MRKLFFVSLALVAAPGPAHAVIPDTGEIVFEILRNGSSFGEHRVEFQERGGQMLVQIDIEMKYALGPIALFRYEHSNEEVWKGNKILSLSSQTYDDGDDYSVQASWGRTLNVETNGERYEAPAKLYTTSYWNPVTLKSDQLLNTQKGRVEDVKVTYQGREVFETANETLQADRYSVLSKVPLDVWYDAETRQWVGLKFAVRGSEIEYKRITPVNTVKTQTAEY